MIAFPAFGAIIDVTVEQLTIGVRLFTCIVFYLEIPQASSASDCFVYQSEDLAIENLGDL